MENIIELVNVYKKYKLNNNIYYLLDNINLCIKKSSITIIEGPSGSGKTTLLNVMSNIDNISSGDIYYNGFKLKKNKKYFGIVFQNLNLFPNLNVYENIKIVNLKSSKKEIINIMEELDLLKYKDKNIFELSGGEMQKIAIARCLVKTKEVIILDEPTKSLDSKNAIKIMEFLKTINQKYKTTIILSTHDKSLENYGDKIIKLAKGKIE